MNAAALPTVIRTALPRPDAVIARWHDGRYYIVADHGVPDWRIAEYQREAIHCRDGRPFGHPATS